MLIKTPKSLYAGLRGLFCCKCTPETSDPPSKDDIAPKTRRRGPHLSVFVEDPSEVRWDTPTPPMSEKISRSVSNGSVGGQDGHQHTVVEPNKPPLEPRRMQNTREMLVPQTQPATSLSEVDETKSTDSSSVMPRSEETTDDQGLPSRPKDVVRSAVVPSEMDDQESAGEQDSQLGMEREREDVARGSSQGQIIDEDASHPLSMVDDQSHYTIPPDTGSQGKIAQVQARLEETLGATSDKVDGTQPLPAQERLPRKKVDLGLGLEVEAAGDEPPQGFQTIEAVVEGEEIVGDGQSSKDKLLEVEVDPEPPRVIVQERLPRKKTLKEEGIVESAQPPRISKDRLPRKKKVEEIVENDQPSSIPKVRLPRKKV